PCSNFLSVATCSWLLAVESETPCSTLPAPRSSLFALCNSLLPALSRLRPPACPLIIVIVSQNPRMIENNRSWQFVLTEKPGELSVVVTARRSLGSRNVHD